jgi:hypothetical protein
MIENQDLYVEVVDWGFHPNPQIIAGDRRVQVRFPMEFVKPEGVSVPVSYFKLRLRTRDGRVAAETVESVVFQGQPLYVTAGLCIDLVWDLALKMVNPDLIKIVLPSVKGTVISKIDNGKKVSL